MLIALDTSTDYASLALHDGLRVRVEYTWETSRKHTVEMLPRAVAALKQLDLTPNHLSGVAVARGPGSFTGLRVGMALAKGLALARGLPLIGVPTLDVIASAQGRDRRPLCAVLQAGRRRICVAIYRWSRGQWKVRQEAHLTTWASIAERLETPTLFCGEIDSAGAKVLASLGELAVTQPGTTNLRRAGFLAEIAWQRLNTGDVDDPATLAPIYLQHPAL